jgi:prohibitin 2
LISYRQRGQVGSAVAAIVAIVVVLAGVIWALNTFHRVDPGHNAVKISYAAGGEPKFETITPGQWFAINPATERVVDYPAGQWTLKMVRSGGEGAAKGDDSVTVQDKNGIALSIDSTTIWEARSDHVADLYLKRPGLPLDGGVDNSIEGVIVRPEVRNALTMSASKYTYDEIYGDKKAELQSSVKTLLEQSLPHSYITLDSFMLGEVYPQADQQKALSDKANAQQASLQAQYLEAKSLAEARAKVAEAEGAKQVAVKKAEGEAEAIRVTQEQLAKSPLFIEYLKAQKWDGKLPQVQGNAIPMVDLSPAEKKQ